jgi:hypothetical protein
MPEEDSRISFLTRRWRRDSDVGGKKPSGVSGIFRGPFRNIPQFDLPLPLKTASYQGTLVAEIEVRSFKRVSTASGSELIRYESGARYRSRY